MTSKIFVILATLVLVSSLTFAAYTPPPPTYGDDDDDDKDPLKPLYVTATPACDGNVVTVTSKSSPEVPVEGVDVTVWPPGGSPIFSGQTDENGQIVFEGCGMTVGIYANLKGYSPVTNLQVELIPCAECEDRECYTNDECPDDKVCDEAGSCVLVDCECGERKGHVCVEYDCCSDADCPAGKVCEKHLCVPPKEEPEEGAEEEAPGDEVECSTDDDCASDEYCNDAGECMPVTGDCGYAENHMWIPSECGPLGDDCPECPTGYACEAQNDTDGLVYSCVAQQNLTPDEQPAAGEEDEGKPEAAAGDTLGSLFLLLLLLAFIFGAIVIYRRLNR